MYNKLMKAVTGVFSASVLATGISSLAVADDYDHNRPYRLQGPCAYLPADRATEFHGNADNAELRLGMAGNQWVVFDAVMQGFNVLRGTGDGTEPAHHANKEGTADYWTLEKLQDPARNYYIQLIPPGQIRKQIKSGCLTLGNDEERNFLPGNIQVKFDIFASTNYNLMRDLASNGFITEAAPYIKNKLDLMVADGNPLGIGTAGPAGSYANIFDLTMDLLDAGIRVSEVDHINEGIHNAINRMYQSMDEYIREHGSEADIAALDARLAAVVTPQPGSPAATRTGVSTDFNLASNPACHYTGHATIADNTLRFCEFAILNKANTHETRVHHVETPEKILNGTADVGPVWISELGYQLVRNVPVDGVQGDVPAGVASPVDANPAINAAATYSIAVLATSENRRLARMFLDYVRSPDGQRAYTDGGFIGLSQSELDAGECYGKDSAGNLVITPRNGGCAGNSTPLN